MYVVYKMSALRPGITVLQLCRSYFKTRPPIECKRFSTSSSPLLISSTASENGSQRAAGRQTREIGETTILVQEGLNIQEVPVAVLKSHPCKSENEKGQSKSYIKLDPEEESAFVDGFSNFNSPREVLRMLDTIPSQEVTPVVSLSILRKLFELENNFGFRNEGKSWVIAEENSSLDTFARTAIVSRLVDIIISADDDEVLVNTLEVLRKEKRQSVAVPAFGQLSTPSLESLEDYSSYGNRLCNEVLVRTTEGRLSLENACRAIVTLGEMDRQSPHNLQKRFIDKMLPGILSKSGKITPKNLLQVFSTIPYLTKARCLVVNLVERKMLTLCWNLDISSVADICQILVDNEKRSKSCWNLTDDWGLSPRFMICLSRCAGLNLHLITEEQLSKIVNGFLAMEYFDSGFEKVLNKYMKAKSRKIVDPNLVASLMKFVKHFRLRKASHVMEGAGEYLIQRGPELTPSQIHSIVLPFGLLEFQPPSGPRFWEVLETVLSEKFAQFSPNDFIDVLLACVYLKKYPLNFVDRVFSPYFLDRVHTSEGDFNALQITRSRLKLLDIALTLECPAKYSGPILPRDFTAKSIFIDNRIHRGRRILSKFLFMVFSETDYLIEAGVPLPNMPLNELYIIDFIITPNKAPGALSASDAVQGERDSDNENPPPPRLSFSTSPLSLRNRINLKYSSRIQPGENVIAVLIHLPEHYSADGEHLTGPQVMRARHLRALGFHVFTFKFEKLRELSMTPQAFLDNLKESFSSALLSPTP